MGTRAAIVCSPSPSTRSVGTSIIAQRIRFQHDTATKSALADKLLEMKVRATFVERIGSAEMAAITLSADNGKIIVEGTTSNGMLPARAATLAREIEGVDDIDNRIVSVPNRGHF